MRIAIVGAGGVGSYFGGRLAQAGLDVVFIARGKHCEALRAHGLKVESTEGDFVLKHVRVADDPRHVGGADVVLLCVKAWQVADAVQGLHALISPQTCVVPLQNGVEAPGTLVAELGREHVLGGLCSLIVSVVAPGHIRHAGGAPMIKFGELDNVRSERVERLHQMFSRAHGLTAAVPPDIDVALWEKFIFISAWGGIGALTRVPIGIIRSQPSTRQVLRQVMQEIFQVAKARGIALEHHVLDTALNLLDEMPADGTASMQRDIMSGLPSELDAQTGAVVRLGGEAGTGTPINALIHACLLPQELRARGQLRLPTG